MRFSIFFVLRVGVKAAYSRKFTMSKSIDYRSLKAAADKRAAAKQMAAGDEASQLKTKQLVMDKAKDGRIRNCFATPKEPDASAQGALL